MAGVPCPSYVGCFMSNISSVHREDPEKLVGTMQQRSTPSIGDIRRRHTHNERRCACPSYVGWFMSNISIVDRRDPEEEVEIMRRSITPSTGDLGLLPLARACVTCSPPLLYD